MYKFWNILLIHFLLAYSCPGQEVNSNRISIKIGETAWWCGVINHGERMPLKEGYTADFSDNYGNQIQPLLLSNAGQTIWSEGVFTLAVKNDTLFVLAEDSALLFHQTGSTLQDAFHYASSTYFPPAGKLPDKLLFSAPQYNTWIELQYNQNQHDILQYANDILSNEFPPGVLMVDDNWQEDYGKWDFHPGRFSDPGEMIDSLHRMGFKIMLWICPFVSPDCDVYRMLESNGMLLRDSTGQSAIVRWWNGASGLLDLSNPETVRWFLSQLDRLQSKYGIEGFKFDAGDPEFYQDLFSHENIGPNDHCKLFAGIGLNYPLNEYRAMWKMAGQPLVNRLRDKFHTWEDLHKLIPDILLQGLVGYNFTCPDMVGGGDFISFLPGAIMDQDLIVRSAQTHALMPMMQFSVAPWRILDEEHLKAVKKAIEIRQQYTQLILNLATESARTGAPIVRSMEYLFPHKGYQNIDDQFLLGDSVLVAPFLGPGEGKRQVMIPEGTWKDRNGKHIRGPKVLDITVGLDVIPIFELIGK
jgi:alpha-glucosidase (family GH31 glycosyl hydrolase)